MGTASSPILHASLYSTILIMSFIQGLRWLRTHSKTEAAQKLKRVLHSLSKITTIEQKNLFLQEYAAWLATYKSLVRSLPSSTVAYKDLKKTMALITHAIPDMFHYLDDPNIPALTNCLESFFSRLKSDFRRHRGLSETHKQSFLRW